MRTALVALLLAVVPMSALTACGKKKAPANPANSDQAAPADDSNEEKSVTAPDEKEDGMNSSDPCEGGE